MLQPSNNSEALVTEIYNRSLLQFHPRNPRGLSHEITIKSHQMSCLNHGKSPLSQVKSPLSQVIPLPRQGRRRMCHELSAAAGGGGMPGMEASKIRIKLSQSGSLFVWY